MTNRIDTIRDEIINDPTDIGYAALGQDYPAIAAAMNARPMVDNPQTEAAQVPKRLTMTDIFTAITPTEARALYGIPGFRNDVERAVEAGDRAAMQMYIAIAGDDLSANSIAALASLLTETENDPAWSAQIPGQSRATALGVAPVRATDVQEAMN